MRNRQNTILIITILISVVLRVATAIYLGNLVTDMPGTADQISYHNLALRVLQGKGFSFGQDWWPATAANAPTAHWSYLYTIFLVAVYALFGPHPVVARLIQAVIVGILQPILAYLIGREVFGRSVGLVAAVLTSLYTYFIYYAANLMTETFYITFILASFYFALQIVTNRRETQNEKYSSQEQKGVGRLLLLSIALGLSVGAAVLLRQLFLLFVPFLFIWVALGGRKQLASLVVSTLVIILLIAPITVFNYARFERFVLVNTNAGFAFFWGNHPIYGTHFQSILPAEMGSYQDLIPTELRSLDEAALDQALLKRGIQFVLDDPGRYVLLSISRIPAYFMFWPSSDSGTLSNIARVTSFGVLWPFMLYGVLISLFRKPSPFQLRPPAPMLLFYLFIVVYSAIHILTWTLIRYRLPVDAILLIFAGLAFEDLARRIPLFRRISQSALLFFQRSSE